MTQAIQEEQKVSDSIDLTKDMTVQNKIQENGGEVQHVAKIDSASEKNTEDKIKEKQGKKKSTFLTKFTSMFRNKSSQKKSLDESENGKNNKKTRKTTSDQCKSSTDEDKSAEKCECSAKNTEEKCDMQTHPIVTQDKEDITLQTIDVQEVEQHKDESPCIQKEQVIKDNSSSDEAKSASQQDDQSKGVISEDIELDSKAHTTINISHHLEEGMSQDSKINLVKDNLSDIKLNIGEVTQNTLPAEEQKPVASSPVTVEAQEVEKPASTPEVDMLPSAQVVDEKLESQTSIPQDNTEQDKQQSSDSIKAE